jgi:hypothetical protein
MREWISDSCRIGELRRSMAASHSRSMDETTRPTRAPMIAGAITMGLGAALYLFDTRAAASWHLLMWPAMVLMAFGALLTVLGVVLQRAPTR